MKKKANDAETQLVNTKIEVDMEKIIFLKQKGQKHKEKKKQKLITGYVRQFGIIHPIPCIYDSNDDKYLLIGREYQREAAKQLGMKTIPVVVMETLNDINKTKTSLNLEKIFKEEALIDEMVLPLTNAKANPKQKTNKTDMDIDDQDGDTEKNVPVLPKKQITMMAINKIVPYPNQARLKFDKDEIEKLSISIEKHGFTPLELVYNYDEDVYYVIKGERRLRAAELLKLTEVPAFIIELDYINDNDEIERRAIADNTFQIKLHIIEMGRKMKTLLDTGKYKQYEIAEMFNCVESRVSECLKYAHLGDEHIGKSMNQLNRLIPKKENSEMNIKTFEFFKSKFKSMKRKINDTPPSQLEPIIKEIEEFLSFAKGKVATENK